mmetsp:Transcript_56705/g.139411  ORF Transcript_56705/g.139411 Transcript_56705/m.139411 type:complete len:204 (+) Transcript_56705:220-831(+)
MSDALSSSVMRSRFGSMPTTHLSANERMPSPSRRTLCSTLATIIGRNTLSSKWPLLPATLTPAWLPITCAQIMVSDSHCVGFTLPGMIDEPGSFSGSSSSATPARGPEPSRRTSLATFMSDTASVLSAPLRCTRPSHAASASNLLGAVTNGSDVRRATSAANASAKPTRWLRPVPTAVPPCASSYTPGSAASTRARPRRTCSA